jgi:hypothetical protein
MGAFIAHARTTEQLLTCLLSFSSDLADNVQQAKLRCLISRSHLDTFRASHRQARAAGSPGEDVLHLLLSSKHGCVALVGERARYKALLSTRYRRKLCGPDGVVLKLVLTSFDWRAHVAVVRQPP